MGKAAGSSSALPFSGEGTRVLFRCCLLLAACCLLLPAFTACRNRALLDQARQAVETGDHQAAVSYYEEFLKAHPNHDQTGNAHFEAGNIYLFNLKQYDKAVAHYIQLIEGSPRSPHLFQARQRLAKSYVSLDRRREAINEYENLLTAFPDQVDQRRIRLEIADLYFEQNDLRQARTEYQKVISPDKYDSLTERAYLQIGGICVLLENIEDAIPVYQTVVRQTPDQEIRHRAALLLADCYQRTLQFEEAVKTLEQTEPDPKAPDEIKRRIAAVRELQKQRGLP